MSDITLWLLSPEERKERIKKESLERKKKSEEISKIPKLPKWELWPDSILKLYKEKYISKDYALYMLKVFIEWEFNNSPRERENYDKWKMETGYYIDTTILLKALGILLAISGITKENQLYMEYLIISSSWYQYKSELIYFYANLFPSKSDFNIIGHCLEYDEKLTMGIVNYHRPRLYLLLPFITNSELRSILGNKRILKKLKEFYDFRKRQKLRK